MSALRLSVVLSTVLLLGACSGNGPESVSERYWQAVLADDEQAIQEVIVEGASPSLSAAVDPSPGTHVSFGHPERESYTGPNDETRTIEVPTTVHWVDEDKTSTFETRTHLLFEEGEWKVDPAKTRDAFFESVYRSALSGLEAALEDSAEAFRELGSEMSRSMARELSEASRTLQEQSDQANQEIQRFLKNLDEDLQKELEERN